MKIIATSIAVLTLAGCATVTPTNSGFLTSYEGLTPRTGDTRAEALEKRDEAALAGVRRVLIEPTRIAERAALPDSVDAAEAQLVAREMDRQLCFALSERFEIAAEGDAEAVRVRAAVTGIQATSGAASVASAAISRAIPGPGSVRLPVGRGGLTAELEALAPGDGRQIAALSWSRGAGVAFDRGSLSDVGDAHRYADAFAEAAVRLLAPGEATRERTGEDPCARFGPRLDMGRQAARFALGLHTVGAVPTDAPAESQPPAP
jgi:hypothetical protein